MGETPEWGTPEPVRAPAQESPAYGAPGPTVPALPSLLSAPEFVMRERAGGFMSDGYYELFGPDETPLGAVTKVPGSGNWLFGSSTKTFELSDASGAVLATISQPNSWGRTRFLVSGVDGREIGTLEQENSFLAPRLAVLAADGSAARLTGGGFGSGGVRTLTDAADRPIGDVSKRHGWGAFFTGTDIYLVRLASQLTGDLRLLAVVATACIDLILNDQQRRNNSGNGGGITFGS